MLELRNINFNRNNKQILNNINLELEEGKFYVITGPNGSGKSTLAKLIMGIEKPDSGKIIFDNNDITGLSIDERANRGISFAFQQPIHFKGITVYDLLKIAIKKDLSKCDACSILAKVGLCAKNYVDREVNSSLSGGELKRIEIATVLARNPKFTIFDEPEAGIDLWSFNNINNIFKEIGNDSKRITLVISHQEKILNIADEIILIEDGNISKIGKKQEMLSCIFYDSKCLKGECTYE